MVGFYWWMAVDESGDGGATPAASTLAVDSISRASAVCQRSAIHRAVVVETLLFIQMNGSLIVSASFVRCL